MAQYKCKHCGLVTSFNRTGDHLITKHSEVIDQQFEKVVNGGRESLKNA